MERILRELQAHPQAWAFLNPVNADDVLDYYEFIKNPMGMYYASIQFTTLSVIPRLSDHGTQARN